MIKGNVSTSFKYLGSVVDIRATCDEDVNRRINTLHIKETIVDNVKSESKNDWFPKVHSQEQNVAGKAL